MKIHGVKASSYNDVEPRWIADYIQEYAEWIHESVQNIAPTLASKDKTQLKMIAAELETVKKRLNYVLNGRY